MVLLRKRQRKELEDKEDSNGREKIETENGGEGASEIGINSSKKKRWNYRAEGLDVGGELALFGEGSKEAELTRVKLQENKRFLER